MPYRITPIVNNYYYHIFNRSVDRKTVFDNKFSINRFISVFSYYRFMNVPIRYSYFINQNHDYQNQILRELQTKSPTLVDIIAYVIMPNHFHFLLKQNLASGISNFINKTCLSYSKYYNTKHHRTGHLFSGSFKIVRVESDEQLLHLTRYIHLNPVVSGVIRDSDFDNYQYSSNIDYIQNISDLVQTQTILSHFKNINKYISFLKDQIDYAKQLESIKHLTFE